jgi:hypothetical protein
MQRSDEIMSALGMVPGGDELLNVTLTGDDGPAVFTIRRRRQPEAEPFTRDRADVLRDLGLLNAQLVSVRFVNDIVYWGVVPV